MQFVAKGPDIPDELLQAHEEGQVVFFCGAGISYPAGLPGFKGLVEALYTRVGERPDDIEKSFIDKSQFDQAIGHFEHRIQGGRRSVRRHLKTILQPDLLRFRSRTTHLALLTLGRRRADNSLRLVTTNFDTLFEMARDHYNLPDFTVYPDPPARERWEGLVYLHGRMSAESSQDDLDRLTLSDGDFGQAYLTEAWASRFMSALFRKYILCFVGYSIDDPVLRYMTAAHALGDGGEKMFAFAPFIPGKEGDQTQAWYSKNVIPILYSEANAHRKLHQTLHMWASIYRDGVKGRERVVAALAHRNPKLSVPQQDDFVGRMLWALSDESRLPAKRFAEFNPVPPLEWLEAFSEDRYQHCDLERFGVPPLANVNNKIVFSFIRRPAPYNLAPLMSLVSGGVADSKLDKVLYQIARWLVRHLNDPALILWLAQRGAQPHESLIYWIENELDRFSLLEQEGKIDELEEIRANAPNAIPSILIRKLWRLMLSGRVKSSENNLGLYNWKRRLERDGLTFTLRLELRELLAPKIVLKEPFRWSENAEQASASVPQTVGWELVLATDHIRAAISELEKVDHWHKALPLLIDDLQQLLRDALDLFRELDKANDREDRSNWYLPSISPLGQNHAYREWVVLIELLRDAWLAVRKIDPLRATRIAQGWFTLPYPTFKRLALFAASHDGCIPGDQWVDWLLSDNSWWLWSSAIQSETFSLLATQGVHLTRDARAKLEMAILAGLPITMFRNDIDPDRLQSIVGLYLVKLKESGGNLGNAALQRLNDLSAANPEWTQASNDSNKHTRSIEPALRNRYELVDWLKQPQSSEYLFHQDNWCETCRTRFFHCAYALCDLAKEDLWPSGRWNEALQVWSEEGRVMRSWRFVAPLVQIMPDKVFQEIAHSVSWWLEAISKSIDRHEAIFLDLCSRVLTLPYQENPDKGTSGVTSAINHPIGQVTRALLNQWFKRELNDNDKLPGELEPSFTNICDSLKESFRHGRVVLASKLITLFRVDQAWTEAHLLPLFDWTANPVEAQAVWNGFLWSPRLYPPLLIAFKEQFLDTARHYTELGELGNQFVAFLTYAALEPPDTYTFTDFRDAIEVLPQQGLDESARALFQALEGAGEQREEYWKNRIQLFWQNIWPKSRERASHGVANSLALLSIAARGEFPSALSTVLDWLRPIEHSDYVVERLHESGLAKRFPEDSLKLLDTILIVQPWAPLELRQCLDEIAQSAPELRQDPRYLRLDEYARRYGL